MNDIPPAKYATTPAPPSDRREMMLGKQWRDRPPADLAANLCHWLHNHDRIRAMSNAELVRECLGTEAADWDVVNEMMTRLHPGWENEPDSEVMPNSVLGQTTTEAHPRK